MIKKKHLSILYNLYLSLKMRCFRDRLWPSQFLLPWGSKKKERGEGGVGNKNIDTTDIMLINFLILLLKRDSLET